MNHDSTELLRTIHEGDSGRWARVALSMCSDASGKVVAQANIHGVTTVLRALVEGLPLPDGGQLPATALVGRLTAAEMHEAFQITAHGVRILTPADTAWPAALDDLGPRRPLALWVHGNARLLGSDNVVALTGARHASTYETHMGRRWWGRDLAPEVQRATRAILTRIDRITSDPRRPAARRRTGSAGASSYLGPAHAVGCHRLIASADDVEAMIGGPGE